MLFFISHSHLFTGGDPNYVNHVLQYYHLGNGDIAKVAQTQIGNINGKLYWEWYGFTSRVEWCACFVSWCASEAGLLEKGVIPKFAYCPIGIQWFKEHNQWMDKGQTPQAGYIIFLIGNKMVYLIMLESLNVLRIGKCLQ